MNAADCLPCEGVPCFDRDGEEVRQGVYSLTPTGRRRVNDWMRRRAAERSAS